MNAAINSAHATDAREFFASSRALIDAELDRLLPKETDEPTRLHAAMRWSVCAGGKRFRPALLLATAQSLGASIDVLVRAASALEMIHTYSLIHDDLPSMDNDDLRRGRPTCHIKFGEATAILAGDALQTLAFHTIVNDKSLAAPTRLAVIAELTAASGTPNGMVAGQALDIEAEARTVNSSELEEIHRLKTGALIVAAARCGAIIAGANQSDLDAVTSYAAQVGLLFQITDDLLDVTATAEDLGKTPGKDARSLKATYPGLFGIEETRQAIVRAHRAASDALNEIDRPTDTLRRIADFIRDRTG